VEQNVSHGLSPLKYTVFKALWIASIVSNIGSLMEAVGESWLMTSLTSSALLVALAYAADSIAIVLLALPAGALADIINRRWVLIASQAWMMGVAAGLGVATIFGLVSPLILLVFIFLLGLGEAMSVPAFSPFLLNTLPRSETKNAMTLIAVAMNLGRSIGPAIGGIIVASSGPAAVFFLNAFSFAGVIVVLLRSKSTPSDPSKSSLPAERMAGAIRAGIRYVKHSKSIHAVLVRVASFAIPISVLPALLPAFVRHDLGSNSSMYGILYGLFGISAIVFGLLVMPRVNKRYSSDQLVVIATVAYATSLAIIATTGDLMLVGLGMAVAGVSQIMAFASISSALYSSLPNWVTARVASFYQLILQASLVGGSVAWGAIADQSSLRTSLFIAAGVLAATLATALKFRLGAIKEIDISPSNKTPSPNLLVEPEPEQGPVLVQIEYIIEPQKSEEFLRAMYDVGIIRKRDGAFFWGVFRHDTRENVYIESFLVESWIEHMRQHERITKADRVVIDRAVSFHKGVGPPPVSHFIAEAVP
jgi:MFS family permease